ncbi:hypothetical protein BP5796_07450 [Coleophoma crateriformis]|uniref:Copper transport protein n=1 Tax=Coleophoma crateriformis TaxID=565419 RepID=A0A3D8RJA1_9HELO|nr:hypothetical protein BP5796_07450 [Coleophoma crateriformis]
MSMGMSSTATSAAAAATTSSMSMDMSSTCQVSMLWNWYTIDACFISSTWRITTRGMFAGSCIGVILLVMSLEFLRRLTKEYDRYIIRQYQRTVYASPSATPSGCPPGKEASISSPAKLPGANTFRPNMLQQAVRATLHMLQFAVAYFIMLLAMYFNGYIIICIIIGAWLGAFAFSWESVSLGDSKEEATVCCG